MPPDPVNRERWRVGCKVGRTIYAQAADEPNDHDALIGMMDTRELAKAVVEAHNLASSVADLEAEVERLREPALEAAVELERIAGHVEPDPHRAWTVLTALRAALHPEPTEKKK